MLVLCLVPHALADVPPSFEQTAVIRGLTNPTQVRFAPGGKVFVAEKSGLILEYSSLSDPTPTTFADLRTQVDDYWDRGLLSIVLDPNFSAAHPYVWALFTLDAPIGGTPPVWNDACMDPTGFGCLVSGRLVRLTADPSLDHAVSEQDLLDGWCQQFPSHSVGDLAFGSDGSLYVSGGEGAHFFTVDVGRDDNACNDPDDEGGAVRSQSLLRRPGEPAVLSGSILRLDPTTAAAKPDNPLAGSADPVARRIIASGLRNPFRFTTRPGTNEVWVGDVGWNDWEEIDRIQSPTGAELNFGWPCYEGINPQPGYETANIPICALLYSTPGAVTAPYYTYNHSAPVVPNETCPPGSSSISGMAFYGAGPYPAQYTGALFFADYSRKCIWVMFPGANGLPDAGNIATFVAPAAAPVDLEIGPDGNLYYVDLDGGTVNRIRYFANDLIPTAEATATPTSGDNPLTVQFNGSGSSDPDPGDVLTYHWDFGDGQTDDDSGAVPPAHVYENPGIYTARLTVTDQHGATNTSDPIAISVADTLPTPTILTPSASTTWKVGDTIDFSGQADDEQDGPLPDSALTWTLILHHCPSNCHIHIVQSFAGTASGSFSAPDHDYPSYLELQLKATDSGGNSATTSVNLQPKTSRLSFDSSPRGVKLVVGPTPGTTPFQRTVILGSRNTISAPQSQALGPHGLEFVGWSDGKPASHDVIASTPQASYTATYRDDVAPLVAITSPAVGTRLGGRVSVKVAATDDTGVAGVQLKLDGTPLGPELKRAPFTLRWRTGLVRVGPHTLSASARDAAGNATTSTPVRVTVFNPSKKPSGMLRVAPRRTPRLLRLPRWLFVRWR